MNYYPFHIGDFNNATRHLDRIERSIYRDLLDLYYDKEQPLANDIPVLARKIMAREYEDIVELILGEFFTLDNDVIPAMWRNARCDADIAKYQSKADSARRANQIRWGSETTSDIRNVSDPNQEPITNNHKPKETTTTSKPTVLTGNGEVPFSLIIKKWNDFAEKQHLPKVVKVTTTLKGQIRQRWKDMPKLENWDNFFTAIGQNDFLSGRAPPGMGRSKPFRSTLAWVTKESNFAKIAAEEYD